MLACMQHASAKETIASARSNDAGRNTLLQRLLPLWPHEIADGSAANRQRIVRLLAKALREERRRGISGHWAYDLSRHAALARLYRQECDALSALAPASGARRRDCGKCG